MELLLRRLGVDTSDIQVTKTPYIYLFAIIGFIYILKSGILIKLGFHKYSHILIPLILCCIGLTIGYKDIDRYINWQGGVKKNLSITIKCWLLSGVATVMIYRTQCNPDVQQLNRLVIKLSELYSKILGLMLTGIGEEFLKFLCFIMMFTLLRHRNISKADSMILSVFCSAVLFGALHINYNPEMWAVITLGIGLSACVEFYFLFKYKTMVPLILAHIFQDIISIMAHTEQIGDIILLLIELIGGIIGFWFMLRSLFHK